MGPTFFSQFWYQDHGNIRWSGSGGGFFAKNGCFWLNYCKNGLLSYLKNGKSYGLGWPLIRIANPTFTAVLDTIYTPQNSGRAKKIERVERWRHLGAVAELAPFVIHVKISPRCWVSLCIWFIVKRITVSWKTRDNSAYHPRRSRNTNSVILKKGVQMCSKIDQ